MSLVAAALLLAALPLRAAEAEPPDPGAGTSTTVAERAAGLEIDVIPDAWPALPRVIGYEFNMKNHTEAPSYEGGGASEVHEPPPPPDPKSKRKRYRVIGVVVRNETAAPFEGTLAIRSEKLEPRKVKVVARSEVTTYHAILDRADGSAMRIELLDPKDVVVARFERALPPALRPTMNPHEARFVAAELTNEDHVRARYPSFPVSVRVAGDGGHPLANARLTLHHEQFGMIVMTQADAEGRWSGRLLGGAWTAIAFGAATEEGRADETTIVRTPRTLYLMKQFEAAPSALSAAGTVDVELKADQVARICVKDETGQALETLRLTVAPHRIAEALRFADVGSRCRDAFILELDTKTTGGAFDLLTNKGASYDLMALVRVQEGITALLTLAGSPGDGEVALVFSPARMGRLIFDPPTGFGGGCEMRGEVTLLGAQRQSYAFRTRTLETVYVPAGKVRLECAYRTRNGDALTFIPRRLDLKPGQTYDATPRAPFNMTLFTKKDRGVQVWVALSDGAGQIVQTIEAGAAPRGAPDDGGPVNLVVAWKGQEKLFEQPLHGMSFAFPTGLERIDLANVLLETRVRIGTERLRGQPAVEQVRRFQMHGTWAVAPRIVEDYVDAFLAMVAKSCEAEKKFLGGPAFPVGMDFQVFLPPGVGGLGGGGMIALELGELLRFTDETDPLPYAFCHELGHNVGFGHDPYMLLAPVGVEEGTYGALGYRMANGRELETVFRYLEGRRFEDRGTWVLSPHVFAGIRLLYGGDAHRKMFDVAKAHEAALKAAGLSSIERIATQYSIALGENVAWIFRAYGWPVFDARVNWGRAAAATRGGDVKPINADMIQVAGLRRWWVERKDAASEGGVPWQAVLWPTDFITLDEDRGAPEGDRAHRLFTRISVPQGTIAYLVGTSDCALEVRLNGHAVARFDASPQLNQPVHDELMLDTKRAFPVLLLAGENTIEVEARQPAGSRGFLLGLAGGDGRPIAARLRPDGPEGETLIAEQKTLKQTDPVLNPGFEQGEGTGLLAWIAGPIEGGLRPGADDLEFASGRRSLRFDVASPGAGGIIQRVVVEPGAVYRIRAKLKTDKLDGEAYVSLFTGEITNTIARTEPLRAPAPKWVEVNGRFASQKRRCVYVCAYVKAKSGTVWFDDIELIREK